MNNPVFCRCFGWFLGKSSHEKFTSSHTHNLTHHTLLQLTTIPQNKINKHHSIQSASTTSTQNSNPTPNIPERTNTRSQECSVKFKLKTNIMASLLYISITILFYSISVDAFTSPTRSQRCTSLFMSSEAVSGPIPMIDEGEEDHAFHHFDTHMVR